MQVAKFTGDFVWHRHDESDDFFLVLQGKLLLDLPDETVELSDATCTSCLPAWRLVRER